MAERLAEATDQLAVAGAHGWWAGLVSAGLDALRHAFKLSGEESAAWDTVTGLIKSLLPS